MSFKGNSRASARMKGDTSSLAPTGAWEPTHRATVAGILRPADEHVFDAFSVLMRLKKRRRVTEGREIQHDEIRMKAFAHETAVTKAEDLRRKRRCRSNGALDGKPPALHRIAAHFARKGAVITRMHEAVARQCDAGI